MSWTRRWGIIGSIALAQLGIIVGYQALLSPGPARAFADDTVAPPVVVPTPPPAVGDGKGGPVMPPLPDMPPTVPGSAQPPLNAGTLPKSNDLPTVPAVPPSNPIPDLTHGDPLPPSSKLPLPPGAVTPPSTPAPGVSIPCTQVVPSPQPHTPLPCPGSAAPPPVSIPPIQPISNQQSVPAGPLSLTPIMEAKPETVPPCPWNLSMEIIEGRTVLTARNGTDVQFKMSCEKLDLQTPRGRMDAIGKVKISSENLEGNCEKLTISWHEDVIVLEKVQLKCKLEGYAADMQAEQLRLRLSRVLSTSTDSFDRPPTRQLMPVAR
jgi:hypothetical protein